MCTSSPKPPDPLPPPPLPVKPAEVELGVKDKKNTRLRKKAGKSQLKNNKKKDSSAKRNSLAIPS